MHHNQSISHLDGLRHVVGDHQGRQVTLGDDTFRQRSHQLGALWVERGGVLIEKHDIRIGKSRHEQAERLALSAGKQADLSAHAVFQAQLQALKLLSEECAALGVQPKR